ncbi:hypothetical protein [Flavobacterium chungangensis]|uniref:Uncharacterized protein n=1 Tax=Flavobacterium chungangensis TaxID=2708132 RepID=A0ABV8ZE80_9FLAO
MTPAEETQINNRIWNSLQSAFITLWSELEKDKSFYRESLNILLNGGDVTYEINDDKDMSGLTRILTFIGLPFKHIAMGLRLSEDSKVQYRDNKMIAKPFIQPVYEKKQMSIGKTDTYDNGRIGWAQQILLNKDKEEK